MLINHLNCYNPVRVGSVGRTFFSSEKGFIVNLDIKTGLVSIVDDKGNYAYTSLSNIPYFVPFEHVVEPEVVIEVAALKVAPKKKITKKKTK